MSAARRWPFALALVGAGLDQASKAWADAHVRDRGVLPLLDGFLELRYTRNPGAFFGFGGALPDGVRRLLLAGAGLGVAVLVVSLHRRAQGTSNVMHVGVALVLAGIVGNLVDRVLRGDVVDFLHLQLGDPFFWTTFNLADVWIGMGLLLLACALARTPEPVAGARSEGHR